jgi:hypothetical protein
MLTGTKQTLHASQHPSLLVLRKALSAAESVAPARPPHIDANERLAMQLIARMQARYKKSLPFFDLQDIPGPYAHLEHIPEMAGTHAR